MASMSKDSKGRIVIQFTLPNKKRGTIRLNRKGTDYAETFKRRLESLVSAMSLGESPDVDTRKWCSKLWQHNEELAEKLASFGLIERRANGLLGPFLEEYIAQHRTKFKPGTITVLEQAQKKLLAFFGADRPLRSIGLKEADAFETFLRSTAGRAAKKLPAKGTANARRRAEREAAGEIMPQTLAEHTVRRRLGLTKQFFKAAVRYNLIDSNPFADKVSRVGGNEKKKRFIDLPTIDAVMDAVPSLEWRTIIALARHGGLRCPSEVFALRWGKDVFFDDDPRLIVRSSKTEHHAGHESRVVPMFTRLRPYLQAAWDAAEPGAVYVVDRSKFMAKNRTAGMRKQFLRYLELAGIAPWPKLFQNLRVSRVTEAVREGMTPKEIETYFGHTWEVSMESYQTVTTADRQKWSAAPPSDGKPLDTNGGALRKALHCGALPSVVECQSSGDDSTIYRSATLGDTGQHSAIDNEDSPGGFERFVDSSANSAVSRVRAAKGAARESAADSLCQSGSDAEARAELRALADSLPPGAVGEVLAVARALAADAKGVRS